MCYAGEKGAKGIERNILIAFFSRAGENYFGGGMRDLAVGNTETAARIVGELTGGTLFKIEPVAQYPKGYRACTDAARDELRKNARPAIEPFPGDLSQYDTVILMYPNWWNTMPMPVWTFLEGGEFAGKRILPLCTHEGSGMGASERDIARLCPESRILPGLALRGSSAGRARAEIEAWLADGGVTI